MVKAKWLTPQQFWRLHPIEFWWWLEASKPEPVYRGKRYTLSGSDADGILADLRAKGIFSKWHKARSSAPSASTSQ